VLNPSVLATHQTRVFTMTNDSMPKLFSENVRRLRMEAGLTQEALAGRCTKYKKQIAKIEAGSAEVNLSMIYVLAQALNVAPGTLLKESLAPLPRDH
jgi:transcriptional regulator with XRE-family HTH domain